MLLFLLFALLSLLGSGLCYFLPGFYHDLSTLWMPFVFAAGFLISLYVLWLVFCFVVSLFIRLSKPPRKPSRFAYWAIVQTSQSLLAVVGARIKFVGFEKIPQTGRFLLVCNHVSGYDHLCLLARLRTKLLSVTKQENEGLFIAGKWMHQAGFLPLDRKNPFAGFRTIQRAIGYIQDDVASVAVSPEGTRSKDGTLLPFHEGSFKIATKTGCSVLVVRIEGTPLIKKNFPFRPTPVTVTLLRVLRKEDYEAGTAIDLSARCWEILRSSYL